MTMVHASAIVDATAELASSVSIGPYAVIGAGVRIDEGTRVGSHCTIEGPTTIGRDNRIHAHASLGGAPQDMKYRGEPTELVIGDGNTIFEFCTLSRGTVQDAGVTRVGDCNWLMAYVHIAHDVELGSHTILANNATLAGHVQVGDWTIIGGLTGVHQYCKVGAHVMTGFQSHVSQDIPPFMTVAGHPLSLHGINAEGLRRRGFSRSRIAAIRQMHRLLYRDGLTLAAATDAIAALLGGGGRDHRPIDGAVDSRTEPDLDSSPDAASQAHADADIRQMLDFLSASTRGIVR